MTVLYGILPCCCLSTAFWGEGRCRLSYSANIPRVLRPRPKPPSATKVRPIVCLTRRWVSQPWSSPCASSVSESATPRPHRVRRGSCARRQCVSTGARSASGHSELESFRVGLHSVQRMVSRMVSSKVQSPPCTHRSHAMWLVPQPCCCAFTDGLPGAALQCQHPLGLTCKAGAPSPRTSRAHHVLIVVRPLLGVFIVLQHRSRRVPRCTRVV